MRPDISKIGYHLWITNKTNSILRIPDIHFRIEPYQTIDVLDYKHSPITIEQAEQSLLSGSLADLYKKNKIVIRQSQPVEIPKTIEVSKVHFTSKYKTLVEIEQRIFRELELDVTDEEFAMQNSESIIEENKPKLNREDIKKG
jgi:hypothetical protein